MKGYLVDTNVFSELLKPAPAATVVNWFGLTTNDEIFVSVLTIGELRRGALFAPTPSRQALLDRWIDTKLLAEFEGRILSVDQPVTERWSRLSAQARRLGTPLPVIDALLAATALEHNLTVVSRNTRDLERTGVPLINPWLETQ